VRSDVEKLIKLFKVKTFGNMKNLEMLEFEIMPHEKLLYIAPTNIKIRNKLYAKEEKFPGTLFISDLRILFRYAIRKIELREFPLLEIHSIASNGNGISGGNVSFCTKNERVDFLVSYKKEIFTMLETSLLREVEQAVKKFNNNESVYDPKKEYIVVDCPNCGALNILKKDIIRACEYCGQPQSLT